MRAPAKSACLIALAVLATAAVAHAGGPFVVDNVSRSGVAQRWQNDTLEWCADAGDLSSTVGNAKAVSWITEAFNKWQGVTILNASSQSVDTASISIKQSAGCPNLDIDVSNYLDYYNADPGPTMIVFDKTGDIIARFMGEENKNGVVGLSIPLASDSTGLYITKGFAVFNGLLLATNNNTLGNDQTAKEEHFKATVLHELGHLLNLDHSQTNYQYIKDCKLGSQCDYAQYIPTMYPQLISPMQSSLIRDDRVTISWLYPTKEFEDQFCTITGEIFDDSGRPLKGVHVTATRVQGSTIYPVDARSFVSGAMYPSCYGDSRYWLHGIIPNRTYRVAYEAIGSEFRGASDFEPLDFPPTGFSSGLIESKGGDTEVSCTQGGGVIEMAQASIDTANPCGDSAEPSKDVRTSSTCSMGASAATDASPLFAAAGVLSSVLALFILRRRAG